MNHPHQHSGNEVTYELLTGRQVLKLTEDLEFQAGWDSLYDSCTWCTVFQSRQFVTAWYQIYQNEYLPIVVMSEHMGKLTGILTLAKDKNGRIIGAGADQAEYQVWLTSDTDGGCAFMKNVIPEIYRYFRPTHIHLKYIPAKAALSWLPYNTFLFNTWLMRVHKQPVLETNPLIIDKELRKKNRREKLNRLKRLGHFTFERILDYNLFNTIFDDLATQYDFRKGAMHNRFFFRNDPLRKAFLLALFKQKLLHATILKLNNDIIASNIGAMGKSKVHLQGINTHLPTYSKFSPGILHFLLLGKVLAEEKIDIFDLTPGKDAYKQGLATTYNNVFEVYIGGRFFCFKKSLKFTVKDAITKSFVLAKIDIEYLRRLKQRANFVCNRFSSLAKLPAYAESQNSSSVPKKDCVINISVSLKQSPLSSDTVVVKLNNLKNLLDYDQPNSWSTRWDFLQDAMHRLETGEQSYSWSEEGRLLCCLWQKSITKDNLGKLIGVPDGAVILKGLYCHQSGRPHLRSFLCAVVKTIANGNCSNDVYIVINSKQKSLLKNM